VIDYVRQHADRFGVEPILAVLSQHGIKVAPSTYYAHQARGFGPTDAELADAFAANTLLDLWVANKRLYGRRKLWKAARRAGHDWGRDQVERLMRILRIEGVTRARRTTVTTVRDDRAPRHPDHIKRRWSWPTRPDQWWVADFTYVWTPAGFAYVSFVTDVFSRRILGWRATTTKHTPLVVSALEQALFTRRRTSYRFTGDGLIHHSDAGSQYTSLALSEALHEAGITGSIGTVGDALDNALMESTIGLFKTEIHAFTTRPFTSWRDVEKATAEWVHWYNHQRLHSSLDDVPPIEFETGYYDATTGHDEPVAA
jgi:putative transposase